MNQRETLDTQLNVFEAFNPTLSDEQRQSDFLFLANIDPALQLSVLEQMERRPKLVALDSMNFWIDGRRDDLDRIVREVDLFFLDEGEARSYSGEANIVRAARRIQRMGPPRRRGQAAANTASSYSTATTSSAPRPFPLDTVVDPTGAGDSFAGGFMGLLASTGDTSHAGIRRAAHTRLRHGFYFAVQDFSADKLTSLTVEDIQDRFARFAALTHFDPTNHLIKPITP